MLGRMMFQPLLISNLIDHAERYHADTAIISKNTDGSITETNWANVAANSKRFANVLAGLGLLQSDRVATIAWNNHRHLESWYAISGSRQARKYFSEVSKLYPRGLRTVLKTMILLKIKILFASTKKWSKK